jgi:hypothetical protein
MLQMSQMASIREVYILEAERNEIKLRYRADQCGSCGAA